MNRRINGKFRNRFQRPGISLFARLLLVAALGVTATAQTKSSTSTSTSTTTTRSKDGAQTKTTTKTTTSSSQDKGTVTRNDKGGTFTAKNEGSASASASTSYSNAGDKEMGGGELKDGHTIWEGEASVSDGFKVGGDHASASGHYKADANGKLMAGSNGVGAEFEAGVEAELKAETKFQAGGKLLGAGMDAQAKLDALVKAQGKIGAYIDDKGLTLGVDVKAEAMVSAQATVGVNLTVFGVKATARVTAKAQAGLSANATALVTIGFDGKVRIKTGMGATAGVGAGVYVEAEVDAGELMEALGFETTDELIDWAAEMSKDPKKLAGYLAKEAAPRIATGFIKDTIKDGLDSLFGRGTSDSLEEDDYGYEEGGDPALKGIDDGGSGSCNGNCGSSNCKSCAKNKAYDRDKKYNTWSK
jgi:hypothetical protein